MKTFIFALMALSTSAYAQFMPIKVCGERAVVVDQMEQTFQTDRGGTIEHRTSYQVVLKNKNIIEDFISRGALGGNLVNSKGEFISELKKNDSDHFYGRFDRGRVVTIDFYFHGLDLSIYSSPQDGSKLLAHFYFGDC